MAHAYVNVIALEKYDEYSLIMNHSTSIGHYPVDSPNATELFQLNYNGESWTFPTRSVRFRDYEMLGYEKIKEALKTQISFIELIFSKRK